MRKNRKIAKPQAVKHDSNHGLMTPFSWIKTHPRVKSVVVCPAHSGLWLSATVGGGSAFMREWEGESYCVWGNQWVRAAPLTTPHRVHPPLFVQVCLSRLSADSFLSKHLKRFRERYRDQTRSPNTSDFHPVIHPCAQSSILLEKIKCDFNIWIKCTTRQKRQHYVGVAK